MTILTIDHSPATTTKTTMSVDMMTSSNNNAIVDAARNVDAFDRITGLYAVFQTLPFLHKRMLSLVFGKIVEEEAKSGGKDGIGGEGNNEEAVKPLDKLLTLLCRLTPTTPSSITPSGASSSSSSSSQYQLQQQRTFKEALNQLTSASTKQQLQTAAAIPSKMQLQQLLNLAGLHPAFTDAERAEFAETASAFFSHQQHHHQESSNTSVIITDADDVPSSPTTTSSTPNSLSPQSSLHPDTSLLHTGSPSSSSRSFSTLHGGYGGHTLLHATYSAPAAHHRRVPSPPPVGAWGPKLSLTDAGVVASPNNNGSSSSKETVYRSLSSSPSAAENEDSSGSMGNLAQGEEAYVHIPPKAGMKDVPSWLKGLRLHKYCTLLAGKTYEELLSVDEAQLEAWSVTKGARHKIAVEIEKLRQRPDELCKLAKQLNGVADVRTVVGELRNLLMTPIKTAPTFCQQIGKIHNVEDVPEEDLAARIVVVFRKAANIYLSAMAQQTVEDDCSSLFIQMADKCSRHEAFYGALRSTIVSIKQSLQASMRSTGFGGQRKIVKSYSTVPLVSFNSQRMFSNGQENGPTPRFFISPPSDSFTSNGASPQHRALHRTQAIGKGAIGGQSAVDLDRLLKPKMALSRAKSAPSPAKAPLTAVESNLWYDGLDPDLESLTLSVTEHALDSFENV
ncbi:putative Protein Smaug-like protein 1 [Hypsibius exemplaris]|uniref:SAM domain-containing protein n=1 Tax=Hypsibius exemplaris TaxID=2072580 RepID=A0A1W0X312_HYPEX|nr:putative Protein Smaug-like protein 1 [Hypsibius exemplaris]